MLKRRRMSNFVTDVRLAVGRSGSRNQNENIFVSVFFLNLHMRSCCFGISPKFRSKESCSW